MKSSSKIKVKWKYQKMKNGPSKVFMSLGIQYPFRALKNDPVLYNVKGRGFNSRIFGTF